jgi:hypothetical protein
MRYNNNGSVYDPHDIPSREKGNTSINLGYSNAARQMMNEAKVTGNYDLMVQAIRHQGKIIGHNATLRENQYWASRA